MALFTPLFTYKYLDCKKVITIYNHATTQPYTKAYTQHANHVFGALSITLILKTHADDHNNIIPTNSAQQAAE